MKGIRIKEKEHLKAITIVNLQHQIHTYLTILGKLTKEHVVHVINFLSREFKAQDRPAWAISNRKIYVLPQLAIYRSRSRSRYIYSRAR